MLSLVLAIGMAACSTGDNQTNKGNSNQAGSNAGKSGNNSSKDTDEQVEITFWRHDFAPEAASLNKLIASFHDEYPHIKVNMELIPNDQYETKIRTAIAGQSPPDIMAIDGPTMASYAHQGALLPLDDYLNRDGNIDDIAKPVLESLTYDGKIYAAPNNDASLALFYNIKMFEEAGIEVPSPNVDEAWTWEQVLEAAKALNNPGKGVYGLNPSPWGFAGHEGVPFMNMTFIWQAGADILSPDKSTSRGYLDSEESKQALEFWNKLYNVEKVSPKELPQDALPNEKVAMTIEGPWAISAFEVNYPNFKLGEDYGIAPLWKDQHQVTPNGSWNMGISSRTKHPEEAWLFVNWVTGVEGSQVWYEDTKNLPARLSTAAAFDELTQYPMNIFVEQSANFARPRPVTPAYPAVSEAIRLLFEEVGLGGVNIDAALENAVQKIESGIAQMQ